MLYLIQPSIMFKDRLSMLKAYPNFCLTWSLLKALFECLQKSGSAFMALEYLLMSHAPSERELRLSQEKWPQEGVCRGQPIDCTLVVIIVKALICFTAVGREYLKANYCHGGMERLFSFGSCLWHQAVHMAPRED